MGYAGDGEPLGKYSCDGRCMCEGGMNAGAFGSTVRGTPAADAEELVTLERRDDAPLRSAGRGDGPFFAFASSSGVGFRISMRLLCRGGANIGASPV